MDESFIDTFHFELMNTKRVYFLLFEAKTQLSISVPNSASTFKHGPSWITGNRSIEGAAREAFQDSLIKFFFSFSICPSSRAFRLSLAAFPRALFSAKGHVCETKGRLLKPYYSSLRKLVRA